MPGKTRLTSSNVKLQERNTTSKTQFRTLNDAAGQATCQPWIDFEMHQLSAGWYEGSCTSLSLGSTHIVHERQNQTVQKIGVMPENRCNISLVYSTDPALRFSQFSNLMDSWLFFLPEKTEPDVIVPGNIETLYISLEQDKLLEKAQTLNERYWEKPPRDLHAFNTPDTQKVGADLAALLNDAANTELNSRDLSSSACGRMLIDSLLLALNNAPEMVAEDKKVLPAYRRVHQTVRKAREFIDGSLQAGHTPSIVEICAQTGVSERTLQYAFRRAMDITPVAYLRIVRLNRVRSELLTAEIPGITVTRVATAWGFLHLSKFSQDYQRMFGEYPSETLARACGHR